MLMVWSVMFCKLVIQRFDLYAKCQTNVIILVKSVCKTYFLMTVSLGFNLYTETNLLYTIKVYCGQLRVTVLNIELMLWA